MFRKTLPYVVLILLLIGIGWIGLERQAAAGDEAVAGDGGVCPPGYVLRSVFGSMQEDGEASTIIEQRCEPDVYADEMYLNPIRPGDEGWEIEPYQPVEQAPMVRGPGAEDVYRCVVFLEPLQPGSDLSRSSAPFCSTGKIDVVDGHSLDSSYLIARFYDNTNYTTLLIEYYGASPCSSTISYGVTALPDNLGNRFASGRSYSNCNRIYVYDFPTNDGPSYTCGPDCSSFFALNNNVRSWRTTQ